MRRSAVRRYTAAGVSRSTAMALAGFKTEEVWRRYDIVSAEDLNTGLEKVAKFRRAAARATAVPAKIGPRSGSKKTTKAS